MAAKEFTIVGLPPLLKNLQTLDARVQKKVIRQALRAAQKPMKTEVKEEAPEGPTGQLKDEVAVRAGKRSQTGISVNVILTKVDFEDEKFYASFVEFGAITHPHPDDFMKRAAKKEGPETLAIAEKLIADGIVREAKRGA